MSGSGDTASGSAGTAIGAGGVDIMGPVSLNRVPGSRVRVASTRHWSPVARHCRRSSRRCRCPARASTSRCLETTVGTGHRQARVLRSSPPQFLRKSWWPPTKVHRISPVRPAPGVVAICRTCPHSSSCPRLLTLQPLWKHWYTTVTASPRHDHACRATHILWNFSQFVMSAYWLAVPSVTLTVLVAPDGSV